MKQDTHKNRIDKHLILFAAIIIAATVIRAIWLVQLSASQLAAELSIDSEFYWNLAVDILSGKGIPAGALTFNPLYPIFLVSVIGIFGKTLVAVRIVQSVLGLLTLVLIYIAGRMLGDDIERKDISGRTLGLTAMAMAALYPQFFLYEGMLLSSTLEIFLLIASFALALAVDRELHGTGTLRIASRKIPVWAASLLLGLICGAGALGRPNLFLLLAAGIPVWIIMRNRRGSRWAAPVIGFTAGAALLLLPPAIHNFRHTGKFVPVTTHGGINFYIGNRPGTEGVYNPPAGMRGAMRGLIEDSRALAEKETGHSMTDGEASDYYMDKTMRSISGDPVGWIVLVGKKGMLFWNRIEVHDMPEVLYFEETLPVFRFPFLPYSIIASLSLVGLIVFLKGRTNRSVVCLFIGASLLSVLLFYVNTRYRLPIVPVLIILAALLLNRAAGEISRKRYRTVGYMAAAVIAVFLLISNRSFVEANRGSVYTYLGTYYINAGEQEKAAEAFARAYRIDPDRDTSMVNHARMLMMQGQYEQAARIFSRAYALNPRYPGLAIEYAFTLQRLGQLDDASRLALAVFSSGSPEEKVTACKILSTAAFFKNDMASAKKWAREGLRLSPEDRELGQMLESLPDE